jgi:ABC-type transport system involved in multi-copper enzyme maturation permease subunit
MTKVWAIALVVIKELSRRKDFYVLFLLTALITGLLGSVSFFNDRSIVRYTKDVCLLLIWISGFVIAILTAARQIPAERENRTLLPLLAKPVTRAQVILGKFLGCWLATGSGLFIFYACFALVAGVEEHAWPWQTYIQAFGLQVSMLAIVIAFALFGSLVFAAPSSNTTITFVLSLGLLLVGRHLNTVAAGMPDPIGSVLYHLYFIIPHLEFFDLRNFIVHGWGAIPWKAFALATAYGVAYASLFLVAAWWVFRRKSLN